jgi:hypothetical protein
MSAKAFEGGANVFRVFDRFVGPRNIWPGPIGEVIERIDQLVDVRNQLKPNARAHRGNLQLEQVDFVAEISRCFHVLFGHDEAHLLEFFDLLIECPVEVFQHADDVFARLAESQHRQFGLLRARWQ